METQQVAPHLEPCRVPALGLMTVISHCSHNQKQNYCYRRQLFYRRDDLRTVYLRQMQPERETS